MMELVSWAALQGAGEGEWGLHPQGGNGWVVLVRRHGRWVLA